MGMRATLRPSSGGKRTAYSSPSPILSSARFSSLLNRVAAENVAIAVDSRKRPMSNTPTGYTPATRRVHFSQDEHQQQTSDEMFASPPGMNAPPGMSTPRDAELRFTIDEAAHASADYEYHTPNRNATSDFASSEDQLQGRVDPQLQYMQEQLHHHKNILAAKEAEIALLRQRVHIIERNVNAKFERMESMPRPVVQDFLPDLKPLIQEHVNDALSEVNAIISDLTSQLQYLDSQILEVASLAHSAYSRPANPSPHQSGFIRQGGLAFDIVNIPASFGYSDVRKALAEFFGLEDLPHGSGIIGDLRRVHGNPTKNFSVWTFKLYSEDYMHLMDDRPALSISTGQGEQHTTRSAPIFPALTHEERTLRRARKPIADMARQQDDYIIKWNRAMPYAIHRDTKKRYNFTFNSGNTEAQLNGKTYVSGVAPQQGPNA